MLLLEPWLVTSKNSYGNSSYNYKSDKDKMANRTNDDNKYNDNTLITTAIMIRSNTEKSIFFNEYLFFIFITESKIPIKPSPFTVSNPFIYSLLQNIFRNL